MALAYIDRAGDLLQRNIDQKIIEEQVHEEDEEEWTADEKIPFAKDIIKNLNADEEEATSLIVGRTPSKQEVSRK